MEIGSKEILLDDARVVAFRPVNAEDEQFLIEVYGSTRAEELALTNWDRPQREAFLRMQFSAQQAHYREHYPGGDHLLILVDAYGAGRLYVAEIEKEVRILDITVLPQHRNGGIGTPIIRELMAEAAALGKPLRIYVESFNPSLGFFERLGFVRSAESGHSYLMEWRRENPGA
ncbi:MAG TPA: GNAT family N-acetyltransferase [Blastocatellia bacterium]|nr:GNAT family N-acetyltransferase [Blastocatellia bacterium]